MRKTFRFLALFLISCSPIFLTAQWTKTNGLPGGDIGGFLNYGDTVLVNAGDALYFSANHGQSWTPMPAPSGISLYKASTDGLNLLGYRYNPASGTRLVRTDDFGQNWQPVASSDTMLFYETFFAFGYIYGTDYHGLYRSNNDGASWEYTTTRQVSNIQFDGQRITGSSWPHILQSSDGGFTWDTLLQVAGNVIDMLQHENHLFAFLQNAQHGCYASSDYGQTWQHYTGTAFDQYYDFIWHNGSICGLKGNRIIKSPNLGQTWITIPAPANSYYPAFTGASIGNAILIGGISVSDLGSILRSTDEGDSWFAADFGIIASAGKLRSIGNSLYAASQGGLFKLDSDQTNWSKQNLVFGPSQNQYYGIPDYLHAGDNQILCDGYSPWVSLDNGQTWYESFVAGAPFSSYISDLEPIGDKVIASGNHVLQSEYHISDNNGLTFLPIESLYQQHQVSILSLRVDQGKVFAIGFDYQIYRSDNNCDSWTLHAGPIPLDSIGGPWGLSETVFMVRGDIMVIIPASYQKKMLFSKDGGQTWTFINLATAGLPYGDAPFNDLLQVGNYLLAANPNGVFLSQNNGTDWTPWNDGFSSNSITNLEVHDGFLWAGTQGSGVWKRSLSELDMKPVAGKVFFDENTNGQQDPGEANLGNVVIQSLTTNGYTNSRSDGTYDLLSNLSQDQLKVHPYKPYWIATPATQTVAVPSSGVDFALSLDPFAKDLSVELTNVSVLRPGFENFYVLNWRNNVPIPATDVSLVLTYPTDFLDLLEAVPAPSTQSGGTLTWVLGNIGPGSAGNILLRFKVPVSVLLGTEVCATANISPLTGDLDPYNNTRKHCATVVGSYDPNDKQAEPSGFLNPVQLANNDPVTYTIRFQNTGNFPASFVRITDTLQQTFELGSFQFLSASHPCTWELRGQGEVEFFFNNIQLPPITTDEPGSHGFVKYSIRPRQNLPLGTPLRNTAHIFFDFNAPVTTNTTETLAGLVRTKEVPGQNQSLLLAPNPANQIVRAETIEETGELILQDATGRIVLRKSVESSSTTFSVEGFPQGLYQVVFLGEKTILHSPLAVQR
ncbi:MAG: hypothetical protein ACKVU0_07005 [Saprospiraceae bacterium]